MESSSQQDPVFNPPQQVTTFAQVAGFSDGNKSGPGDSSSLYKDIVENITFVMPEPHCSESKQKVLSLNPKFYEVSEPELLRLGWGV